MEKLSPFSESQLSPLDAPFLLMVILLGSKPELLITSAV